MAVAELIHFGMEPVTPSIIMVAGVGGGGSNAVNHMFDMGIAQVSFMVCNTDRQALDRSSVPIKVRLGATLTEGLGAGNNPDRGRGAALESLDEITGIFKREGTRMVFITAGMGGGTGTGAAPVIAKAAREMGILTVGIVTLPFKAEGKIRASHATEGIAQMREHVDALLVINNENIQEIYGKLPLTQAFGKADDILATAAKGIAEIITRDGVVNVDFADVSTVMRESGIALMGSGRAAGEGRAQEVADLSLNSPLLNHNNIVGAKNILLNISSGEYEITMEEMYGIVEYIQERAGNDANIIWGAGTDPSLGQDIEVTIIATGFDSSQTDVLLGNGVRRVPVASGEDTPVTIVRPAEQPPVVDSPEDAAAEAPPRPPRTRWERPRPAAATYDEYMEQAAQTKNSPKESDAQRPEEAFGKPVAVRVTDNTLKVDQRDDIYANLKDVSEIPSFKRRNAKFIANPTSGARKKVVKEETDESNTPKSGSLFD